MNINFDEQFECTGKKDIICMLGCVFYSSAKKEFTVCPKLKLKKEYAIYNI